ncbi:hypothetical protein CYME_CMI242C [Cyanidioschyzon merolae strain 10D]|jgi:hypothetical protein|uniref:Uncharacterized protein n=1 Tax=Cyanidioschyzon merolae (strain NIES-3377 / 10D) TaxID=280699 RepID=M1V561_CYAM1|nr:hypothetical protein CYME_CMI242C [Cyanidioschyzon merolae strain 10D]BAM80110.1 hypothetical protein CYME_CMI242C [Cyanidioschyzon merolae strain 10D]|eukprot:XP_005536396.1 hypothetical protein CYME_CMI242C [Cyanidioschyzon merolae strain 10D]
MLLYTQRAHFLTNKGFLCASTQRLSMGLLANKNRIGSNNTTKTQLHAPGRESLLRNLGYVATWQFVLVGASLLLVPQLYAKWAGGAAAGELGATRLVAGANLTAALVMHKRTTASEVSNGFGVLAPFLVLDAYQVVSLVLARATLSPLGYVLGGLKVAEAGVGIANWVQRLKKN